MPNLASTAPPLDNTEPPANEVDLFESSPCSMHRQLKCDSNCCNAPPLPPVTGQGEFLGAHPLSPVLEDAPAPMTPPPPLPVEEQLSAVIEELPPPVEPMDIDKPPSPPRAYHPMTRAPLHSHSLVIMSLAPDKPSPSAPKPSHVSAMHGNQGQSKGKKGKDKGKGKAAAPAPVPTHSPSPVVVPPIFTVHEEAPIPKKNLKRKHSTAAANTSEAGSSTQATSSCPTHACSATTKAAHIPDVQTNAESAKAGPLVKKPCFSLEKAAKPTSSKPPKTATPDPTPQDSNQMFCEHPKQQFLAAELTQAQDPDVMGIPIDRHNSCVELENYHFEDLITAPDKFFDPVHYGHKNGTYGACSSHYTFYIHAPDMLTVTSVGRGIMAAALLIIPPVRCMRSLLISLPLHGITFLAIVSELAKQTCGYLF
ncbi:hypothetical protein EV421DRAFT_1739849 [Armillaria borealis]|uniref:Uncharacterized protein n=1 Tax=Armillaria borealis TaxID=47425 RepID=A0AA39J708_9AGAR|nr:hypothetical protein EV421DRAFT_1739849 [Armillaria borealis]